MVQVTETVPLSVWEDKQKYYRENKIPAGRLLDDIEMILRMACLTEDRTKREQNALLRQARRLDQERNKCTVDNHAMWENAGSLNAVSKKPLSDIEGLVRRTMK